MRVVGIVGQSGTGKTTVSEHLEKRGAARVDADSIAHEILKTNAGVRRAVRARFGEVVCPNDGIDRDALGRIVFTDPDALAALNRIVHPAVVAELAERLKSYESDGTDLVVIDAALLLEVPLPFEVDLIIALRCSRAEQIRRLRAKDNKSKHDIKARLDRQNHLESNYDRADVVVDTEKPTGEVLAEIDQIIKVLLGGESS
jgi:dephospho-CoA kinase